MKGSCGHTRVLKSSPIMTVEESTPGVCRDQRHSPQVVYGDEVEKLQAEDMDNVEGLGV